MLGENPPHFPLPSNCGKRSKSKSRLRFLSETFHKVYFLDQSQKSRLVIYQLAGEGQVTSLPRRFPLGDTVGIRFDFKSRRLYTWDSNAILRVYTLDDQGYLKDPPQLSALDCGQVRGLIVDEPTGKVYMACTQPPAPPQ